MSQELQTMNQQNKLALWSGRILACRNGGQTVKAWCWENGVCANQIRFALELLFWRFDAYGTSTDGLKTIRASGNAQLGLLLKALFVLEVFIEIM